MLICLDFLERTSQRYRELVAPKLDQCRALAVPALTSKGSRVFFEGHLIEESGPGRRPVFFANRAVGRGSTIVVGERSLEEIRAFPVRAGVLEKGEEGVIVADVDLALVGPVAARDPARMGPVFEDVLQAAERREVDPTPFAAGLARVGVLGPEPMREAVKEILRTVAARPSFQGDERVRELLVAIEAR